MRPWFEWMESAEVLGASPLLGPALSVAHLLAMVVFVGANLLVDLRLMGVGLTSVPVVAVARGAAPWIWGGLGVLCATGVPALMAAATELYGNSIFWVKIGMLAAGVLFMAGVRGRVAAAQSRVPSWAAGAVGLLSMLTWLSVAALARLVMMIPGDAFEWLVG